MRLPVKNLSLCCTGLLILAGMLVTSALPLAAQTPKSKAGRPKSSTTAPGSLRAIDSRVEKLQESFVRDSSEIMKQYEEAGQFDRAKFLGEVLLKLDPNLPGLKERLEKLTDQSLESNEFEFDLDVSKGWTSTGAMTVKDRLVRIEATGDYKLSISQEVGPGGLPTEDAASDVVAGIAPGALMGVLVVDKKPGKPFPIGAKHESTPDKSGLLLLKVNVPAGHKCSGKLKVTLGGFARGPSLGQ